MPIPFWLRSHASKPALCDIEPSAAITAVFAFSRIRSSSFCTSSSCCAMLIPPLRARACPPSAASKAPEPNFCANVSVPPAAASSPPASRFRSYAARACRSESVSYARWIAAHAARSPPRSGCALIALVLYATRTSSVDADGATSRSS